jgi:hypothetical protein
VTFTATVAAPPGNSNTPTGTVTFLDGATTLGNGTLSNGTATFTTSTLSAGDHTITASYGGDANFTSATSAPLTQTVNTLAAATVTLTSSDNPSNFGQAVTFTATVAAPPGNPNTPTGTVTFKDGATTLGQGTLANGTATFTATALAVGTHTVTASYGGDSNFAPGTSAPLAQTVDKALTSTTLTITPNPALVGQAVTYTATVTPSPTNAGSPTGSVTFVANGGTVIGSATLSNGTAVLTSSALGVGTYSVVAQYTLGDANFQPSDSAPVSLAVQNPTTTTLAASPNPSDVNQSVTFTATVTGTGGTPTGTVTFLDGTQTLGTAALSGTTATFTTSKLVVGAHSVTARYDAQGTFAGSTSAPVVQNVVNGPFFAIAGSPSHVEVRRKSDGQVVVDFTAFGDPNSDRPGGVSVAWGDVNGDGHEDLIVGSTTGNPNVKVYNGLDIENGSLDAADPDASLLTSFMAYGTTFNVGVFVAAADINGDGFADVITGASAGNPHVKVYDGKAIADATFYPDPESHLLASYFAYDLGLNLGVHPAGGDVNGDGVPDLVTAAAIGNPHVKVYDGAAIKDGTFAANPDGHLLTSFMATVVGTGVGAYAAVGDVNGDGFGDVVVGAAATSPSVAAFSGRDIANGTFNPATSQLDQFFAFDTRFTTGAAVGSADFNGDGKADFLTGATDGAPDYRVIDAGASGVNPPALQENLSTTIDGGLNVGV